MPNHVLVLNATYEPLNVTSVWRACSLVLSEKAEVIEAHPERVIRSPSTTLPHPVENEVDVLSCFLLAWLCVYLQNAADFRRRRVAQ